MKPLKIAIIGPGVMAEAIIAGMLRNNVTTAGQIIASGPELDRGEELKTRYGVVPYSDNNEAVKNVDVVILSVKPQLIGQVLVGLRGSVPADAVVISIVAGATMGSINQGLRHDSIVRVMPNTPAQIGKGISVWTATEEVTDSQKELAQSILKALGQEIYVDEERYLDMATALSGSGPAYVFLFLESMIDAGVHLGFSRRISEQLVLQTVRGSADYYADKKYHPAQLRNEVTSPGGTSAEALYYLEKAGFRTAISRAIWAAYERSQELGQGKNRHTPEKSSTGE
jgi:pyrroline-5-carboxylate reductase